MNISFLPYQPHCFAFGGFEIQTLSAYSALKEMGVSVSKLSSWDRNASFDILHCWGLGLGNYENVFWAKRSDKKVVITALFPYFESIRDEIKFFVHSKIHRERFSKQILSYVDAIVVVNESQANICVKYYNVPISKITVIPNIVESVFFSERKSNIDAENGYILSVGNVCPRKNQVRLAKACIQLHERLVIIGKCLDGEKKYGEELQQLVQDNHNITWIKGLPEGSKDLVEHYAAAKFFALPSFVEQQPISLLEAVASNKPLLIADKKYAKQKYYQNSVLINPACTSSIVSGIKNLNSKLRDYEGNGISLEDCRAHNVAKAYFEVYKKL